MLVVKRVEQFLFYFKSAGLEGVQLVELPGDLPFLLHDGVALLSEGRL